MTIQPNVETMIVIHSNTCVIHSNTCVLNILFVFIFLDVESFYI